MKENRNISSVLFCCNYNSVRSPMAEGIFKKQNPALYSNIEYKKSDYPVAEKIQPQLMQFPLNYSSYEESEPQLDALDKTLRFYE